MKILAGDLGGTKTLLQLLSVEGQERKVIRERRFVSGSFPSFEELVRSFLEPDDGELAAACFGVAGPVIGTEARITNLGWTMTAEDLEQRLKIRKVLLLNDFHTLAAAIPILQTDDTIILNKGEIDQSFPVAILGAGTGLGEAFLIEDDYHGWRVIPSEGGHGDFAPRGAVQRGLLEYLEQKFGHVSYERILSGQGIVNIFTYLRERQFKNAPSLKDELADQRDMPARIAQMAREGNPLARETIDVFIDVYGAEAGNLALKILPRGGVFIAGGVAAKNSDFFVDGRFMRAFTAKGRFEGLLKQFPVELVSNQSVGLMGAIEIAARAGNA